MKKDVIKIHEREGREVRESERERERLSEKERDDCEMPLFSLPGMCVTVSEIDRLGFDLCHCPGAMRRGEERR